MPTAFYHVPVLRDEVVATLGPGSGSLLVDCTIGAAGHGAALLDAAGHGARLLGLDRDPVALRAAREALAGFGDAVMLVEARFSQVPEVMERERFGRWSRGAWRVDAVLADLGVSSEQFDRPERGFSHSRSGPLDMRMGDSGETAAELIERLSEGELADVFWRYGDISQSRRLARAVKAASAEGSLATTGALSDLIHRVLGSGRRSHNPSTLPFQALRIAVNDELSELESLLDAIPRLLDLGGVAGIITFHSLEDRLVKKRFQRLTTVEAPPRGLPVRGDGARAAFEWVERGATASEAEMHDNPRARSARLRAIRRVSWGDSTDAT
jgi:16S rRNA (cytosine1402-N4)-methyltransferase